MDNWICVDNDWFNIKDFCHIWIEERRFITGNMIEIDGYFAMGEWRHNGEEVVITKDYQSLDELRHYINRSVKITMTEDRNNG